MILWESPFKNLRVAAVFAGALAVLAFLNSLDNGFAFDDTHIILENEGIQSLETLPGAILDPYWPGAHGPGLGLWRPAITGTLGLGWAMWENIPVGYHVTNVLLHGTVTFLVVLLLGEILPVVVAFLAGLIFAVHPVHVEAVANVVGMSEVMSALFFLLACLLILRGGEKIGAGRLLAILLLYALAFLTKESAVTLLGMVLLMDASRRDLTVRGLGDYLKARWALYGGMVLVAALILMARYQVLGSVARPFAPLGADLLEEIPRIWTVASTWPHLFRLFFFPQDLVVDYGPAVIPISLGWNPENCLGVVMVLASLAFALLAWRRGPLAPDRMSTRIVGWGVVWSVITLSPTSNLLFLSGILLAERTLYLPSVGFVAVAAWLLCRLQKERPRIAVGLAIAVLCLMAGRSWIRTPTWKNNLEVFHTLGVEHPESGRAQWLLGDTYFRSGRVSEALQAYRVAIGIIGGHYTLQAEIGRRLVGARHDRAAELLLAYAWEDYPEFGLAPGLLSNMYDAQGRFEEAERAARASLAEDSTRAIQHHVLARALIAQGRFDEARDARLSAIRHGEAGHWEQWGWLAEVELARGDTARAVFAMDSARALGASVREHRQIDSFFINLGLLEASQEAGESAIDLHYPRENERPGG